MVDPFQKCIMCQESFGRRIKWPFLDNGIEETSHMGERSNFLFIKIWYLVIVFSCGILNNPSWNKIGISCIDRWRVLIPICGIELKHHLEEYLTNPLKSPMGLYHCSLLIMIVYKEILAVSSKIMNPLNMWIWWNQWSNCSFYI